MNKNKIKILFLIDELRPGGTEKQLILLAENLPRDRFEVTICTFNTTIYQKSLSLDTTIFELKTSSFPGTRNIQRLFKLKRYIKNNQFDLVQTQFPTSEIYATLAILLHKRKPILIGTRRNVYHWISEKPVSFFFTKMLSRFNDSILTNSQSAADKCHKLEKIPFKKIKLIENGIVIENYAKFIPMEAKKKLNLENNYPIIGVVSNWRPVKGLKIFLEAASQLVDKLPEARFILAGFGPQKEELMELSRVLGLQNHVTFLENYPDIPELIAAFDIAVQPSLAESFSNVLIEYMSAKKAIVATRVGDAERVLSRGSVGMLIEPNNAKELAKAILRLALDKKHASGLSNLSRKKVQDNWILPIFIKKYISFYESRINGY